METDDLGKKSEDTEDEKNKKKSKDKRHKEDPKKISEDEKNDTGKKPKEDSYPSKRTRSSVPGMWDCPFCEDKKYKDNLEYLVHLQRDHKCNLPGHVVKKKGNKGKPVKPPKGKGKC